MMDPLFIAIAAGLSLGLVLGYRFGRNVALRVGGPVSSKPLVIGCALSGAFGLLAPASLFAIFATRNLYGTAGSAAGRSAPAILLGISIGIAVVITSSLVVGAFTGSLCARFVEQAKSER